jgi:hypothetical protein
MDFIFNFIFGTFLAHRLQIETGRYRNVPRDERLCQKCSENEIEDEVHFLIKCSENKVGREQLFLQINKLQNKNRKKGFPIDRRTINKTKHMYKINMIS